MRAFVLVAGRGSRLGKYTEDQPKCLTRLGGRSLIERQMATLRAGGIDDIVLVTGYRADMLAFDGIATAHNPDWADTNMVETLFRAEDRFTEDMIVSYGDIVYEPGVLRRLVASPHDVSVIVDRNWRGYWEHRFDDPLSDAESLRMDGDGRLLELGRPPSDLDSIEAQYIGLMRFRGDGVAALRRTYAGLGRTPRDWLAKRPVAKAYMTDLLMEMILTGVAVHAVPIDGGWLEIDTETDYETAAAMFDAGTLERFFNPAAV